MYAQDNHYETRKPTLLVFSPLPPVENGIADYCAELLPEHAQTHNLVLVIDNHVPQPRLQNIWTTIHLSEYLHREHEFSQSIYLYHLGNNPDHEYMVSVLLRHPGVVVLHDISLHHLVDQMTLRWGNVNGYCELLEREYGKPGRLLADQFRTYNLRERAMFYELPMIRLIATRSKAIIVHSWYAKTKVLAQEPDIPVEVIRHHIANSAVFAADSINRDDARDFLGIDQHELLFVSLGFITKAKQIDVMLEVLARCRSRLPKFRYILAGQDQPEHYDILAAIRSYGLEDVVEVTGYVEEEEFYLYSIAADIVFNLRYPTGGETSGTLIRALGVGACVVVVDIGPFAEFPDNTCIKLPWSEAFDNTLMKAILSLIAQPEKRLEISARAKEYIQKQHALHTSAVAYHRILKNYCDREVLPWQSIQFFEYAPPKVREEILARFKLPEHKDLPLWFREMQFPLATPGLHRKVIVFGENQSKKLLCDHLGYDTESVMLETQTLSCVNFSSIPRRSFSLAVLEPKSIPLEDEWYKWLTAMNHVLELDGVLLISANMSWSETGSSLRKLVTNNLQQAGFRLLRYIASPQDISFALDTMSKSEKPFDTTYYHPCWLATKISEFVEPKMSLTCIQHSPSKLAV